MTISNSDLEDLLTDIESDRIERKRNLSGGVSKSIREAICAFANDLPGRGEPGVVMVGVEDDGGFSGLEIDDELLRQLADMKYDGQIAPPPSMDVEKRTLAGGPVAVVIVRPSDTPPVRYKGNIWIRTGPRRGLASAQDERILSERRRSNDRFFDIQPLPGYDLSALNLRQFETEYLPAAFSQESLEANDRTIEQRLSATKFIMSPDDTRPTILGILLLGRSPQDILPGAYIQFLRVNGADPDSDVVDEAAVTGTISDQVRRIEEKLSAHNTTAVHFVGPEREQRASAYPKAALEQIVRNAVLHRTYEGTNAPVRVTWYDDRIEIQSPGGPFGSVDPGNFGHPGVTDYRNPNLAAAMRDLGYVQRFGRGITIAQSQMKAAGHPPIEFTVNPNFVLATLKATES